MQSKPWCWLPFPSFPGGSSYYQQALTAGPRIVPSRLDNESPLGVAVTPESVSRAHSASSLRMRPASPAISLNRHAAAATAADNGSWISGSTSYSSLPDYFAFYGISVRPAPPLEASQTPVDACILCFVADGTVQPSAHTGPRRRQRNLRVCICVYEHVEVCVTSSAGPRVAGRQHVMASTEGDKNNNDNNRAARSELLTPSWLQTCRKACSKTINHPIQHKYYFQLHTTSTSQRTHELETIGSAAGAAKKACSVCSRPDLDIFFRHERKPASRK